MLLKMSDLLEGVDEKYAPMLRKVDLNNFTKCIAQFAGQTFSEVNPEMVKKYLVTWAEHKYHFFKKMGGQLSVEVPYQYEEKDITTSTMKQTKIENLYKEFPGYYSWINSFLSNATKNKIDDDMHIYSETRYALYQIGVEIDDYSGSKITAFFKRALKAPDELITKIAALFEVNKMQGNLCLSIDPVDMMTASDNNNNWRSCYSLRGDCDSHADGCLAAVLDKTTMISFLYQKIENLKFDKCELKKIKQKIIRMWVCSNANFEKVYFAKCYPVCSTESKFVYQLHNKILEFLNTGVKWYMYDHSDAVAENEYGYSEFDVRNSTYGIVPPEAEKERILIKVYDTVIECPCGCGSVLPCSYTLDDEGWSYNGDGFVMENFYESTYCEEIDDYVDCDGDCINCEHYQENHPICSITDEECEDNAYETEFRGNINPEDSYDCERAGCATCPRYLAYLESLKIKEEEEEEEDKEED